jgi:hypothetical protein
MKPEERWWLGVEMGVRAGILSYYFVRARLLFYNFVKAWIFV